MHVISILHTDYSKIEWIVVVPSVRPPGCCCCCMITPVLLIIMTPEGKRMVMIVNKFQPSYFLRTFYTIKKYSLTFRSQTE